MIVMVFGYLILIGIDFYVLVSTENIYHTPNTVFDIFPNASKFVKNTRLGIFNSRLAVWECDQINKLTSVFYASVLLLIINFVITLSK